MGLGSSLKERGEERHLERAGGDWISSVDHDGVKEKQI